jgi:hypothetical protein
VASGHSLGGSRSDIGESLAGARAAADIAGATAGADVPHAAASASAAIIASEARTPGACGDNMPAT